MNIIERKNLIIELLQGKEFMMVDEIADLTDASKATIRRDLKDLVASGKVERFRGGVCLKGTAMTDHGAKIHERIKLNHEEKERIGKYAASLIHEGDIVFLDGGSTTYHMIDFIQEKNIKVVTNSIYSVTKLLQRDIPTYILGGDVLSHSFNIISQDTVDKVKGMNFDLAFLGTHGLDAEAGYSSSDAFDQALKKAVIAKAKRSYILADHTKIGKRKLYSFAHVDDVFAVVGNETEVENLGTHIIKV